MLDDLFLRTRNRGGIMSFTHMHLLLNHFPVIGAIIGIGLLAFALLKQNGPVEKAALGLFVILGGMSVIVFLTGEPAEEAIEHLPGFSETITEKHEEAALAATIALASLGAFSLGILTWFRRREVPRWLTLGTLMLSLVSGTLMGYTAMLGGQVRHTEVRSSLR
jgi:uncharacterized membrane protein